MIAVTSPLGLAITAGACWRLVKLATSDAIFDRPRKWTRRWHSVFLFVTCPWCVALDELCWSWWAWVASVLALSAVAAFMTEKS